MSAPAPEPVRTGCGWLTASHPLHRLTLGEGFHSLAQREQIECCGVQLQTGDLYFFRADHVHETTTFGGDASRVVLATFIGWSRDDERIFVWS